MKNVLRNYEDCSKNCIQKYKTVYNPLESTV